MSLKSDFIKLENILGFIADIETFIDKHKSIASTRKPQ